MSNTPKFCICGKPLRGRTDKKFCCEYCKNQFNNQLHAPFNNLMRNINNSLVKNRRILERCHSVNDPYLILNKELLINLGYQFMYFTHIVKTNNHVIYCCYDFGFREDHNNNIVISYFSNKTMDYIKLTA